MKYEMINRKSRMSVLYSLCYFLLFLVCSILYFLPLTIEAVSPTNGLVGYWNFDEGSGTMATDSSGSGNTGTLTNGPSWTTGKIGGALSFNGSGYIQSPVVTFGTQMSFAFWMNTSVGGTVVSWRHTRFCATGLSGSKLSCTVDGDLTGGVLSANSIVDGVWHHIVYAVNGNNQTLYIDGIQQSTASETLDTTSAAIRAGSRQFGGFWTGLLDEVRVYGRALGAAEVLDIYNDLGGSPSPTPTPTPTPSPTPTPTPIPVPSGSRIFYIDYVGGNDANSGTSVSVPWKRAPGMQGCIAVCASTTPAAGDSYLFKGGVVWPNPVFMWVWQWNGNSGNRIYIGVDPTWYVGNVWSRPIMDGNLVPITGGGHNSFLIMQGSYVTVDNFEFKGAAWTQYDYGYNSFINLSTSKYLNIKNNYFHGWKNVYFGEDSGTAVLADTHYPEIGNVGTVVEYNLVDGSDTTEVQADPNCTGACLGSLIAFWGAIPYLHNNTVRYVSNGFIGANDHAHNNIFEYIRNSTSPGTHENGYENNADCNARFYNNIIRHIYPLGIVKFWMAPNPGCVDYVYNNLMYDNGAANTFDLGLPTQNSGCTPGSYPYCSSAGTVHIYGNTIEGGPDSNPNDQIVICSAQYQGCTVKNNHFITSHASPISGSGVVQSNNLIQTKAQANAQGYNVLNAFAPMISSGGTLGMGTVINCQTCSGISSDINGVFRSSFWDIGAYQLTSGSTGSPPPTPTPSPTPTPIPPPSPSFGVSMGDLNLDHIVNTLDFSLLNSRWNQNYSAYDLFVDGLINSLDFAILSSNWGRVW